VRVIVVLNSQIVITARVPEVNQDHPEDTVPRPVWWLAWWLTWSGGSRSLAGLTGPHTGLKRMSFYAARPANLTSSTDRTGRSQQTHTDDAVHLEEGPFTRPGRRTHEPVLVRQQERRGTKPQPDYTHPRWAGPTPWSTSRARPARPPSANDRPRETKDCANPNPGRTLWSQARRSKSASWQGVQNVEAATQNRTAIPDDSGCELLHAADGNSTPRRARSRLARPEM